MAHEKSRRSLIWTEMARDCQQVIYNCAMEPTSLLQGTTHLLGDAHETVTEDG